MAICSKRTEPNMFRFQKSRLQHIEKNTSKGTHMILLIWNILKCQDWEDCYMISCERAKHVLNWNIGRLRFNDKDDIITNLCIRWSRACGSDGQYLIIIQDEYQILVVEQMLDTRPSDPTVQCRASARPPRSGFSIKHLISFFLAVQILQLI
jgi:hypothetical protein